MRNGKPIIAIVGPSRAGKDTAAEYLRDHTTLRYLGGCSFTGCKHVAIKLNLSWKEAWRTRHERKDEWYKILNEYRKDDPTKLIRECLEHSDIVCGIRDYTEIIEAKFEKLIDLVIWINRNVASDSVLTFGPEVSDITIDNYDTFHSYYRKLTSLAKVLGVWRG